jgi:hypothetical protein
MTSHIRPPWGFRAATPGELRLVGDDYLLPYDSTSCSPSGLGYATTGRARELLVELFGPTEPPYNPHWWGEPNHDKAREARAFACYFLAEILEDETR